MGIIIRNELTPHTQHVFICFLAFGQRTTEQVVDTVANSELVALNIVGRVSQFLQRIVGTSSQVGYGIDQCAV